MLNNALAANWPIAPYGFCQIAPAIAVDWDESFQNKLAFDGVGVLGGIGCLWSPAELDNYLVSIEGCYHRNWLPSNSSFKEHGGFLVSKLTFPHTEGVESFLGIGFGGLSLNGHSKEEEKSAKGAAALGTVGMNWYLDRGCYLSIKGLWIKPIGDSLTELRKETISFALGLHWNWI